MKPAFYESPIYREKQSSLTRKNWGKGVYNHLRKRVKRNCAREECSETFLVVSSDPKKYCSQSCAAKTNNFLRSPGPPISKDKLSKFYQGGLSTNEIAEKFNCSPNKITYWMKKFQIPKRSLSEAIYLKCNPNGDPFCIKKELTPEGKQLLGLGLGIYWGEGNKVSKHSVAVSNSDPRLICMFIEFLIRICQINTDKLRFSLITFNDVDPERALKYWSKKLKVSNEKFGKITVIPPQGKGTYKRKSEYGICSVTFGNMKLKRWIMSQLG